MSEINFLSEDGSKKKNNDKPNNIQPEIAYSNPKEPGSAKPANFKAVQSGPEAAKNKPSKNNNLMKQRKAVLASIKKEKPNAGQIISTKPSFFINIKRKIEQIFKKKKAVEKKNNKEILAESKEIFDKEKSERKAYAGGGNTASENLKNEYSEDKNKWKGVKVIKTNLIQDEVTVFVDWGGHLKQLFFYLFVIFLLIAAGYGGLVYWEMRASQEKEVKSVEIEDLKNKIIRLSKDVKEIQDFQKQLALANSLLNRHIYWTNFFEFLEKNTLANVYYNGGFSGNTEGKYSFAATTDNYKTISDQMAVMRNNPNVINVSINSGTQSTGKKTEDKAGETTVSFQMSLDLDTGIFTPLGDTP